MRGDKLNAALSQFAGVVRSAERRVALNATRVVRDAAFDRLGDELMGGADAAAASGFGRFWLRHLAS